MLPVEIVDDKLCLLQLVVYLRPHLAVEECLVEHHEGLLFASQCIGCLDVLHYVYGVAHSRYIIMA